MQGSFSPIAVIALAILNIPLFIWLGRLFFGGWQGFFDCIVFWFKPDLWSLFQGQWWDDMWAELKLGAFFTLCSLIILVEVTLLSPLFAAFVG